MREIYDIINFFGKYYNKFIMERSDSVDEKINKLIMFFTYLLLILMIIGSEYRNVSLGIIILLIIVKKLYIKEEFIQENKCRKPTIDNPFMNPLYENDNLEACKVNDKEIMDKYYNNLNRNINDVFEKKTGQLYYKTNNVTTIPNKYGDFLNFIKLSYDEPDNNCKYNGVNCLKYNDLRYH